MNLLELFDEIESPRFAVQLSVVSGFSVLQMALRDSDELKQLINAMQGSPRNTLRVFQRLLVLLQENPHPEYQHPFDEAITGYLYAINRVDTQLVQRATRAVLETPRLWWARRLGNHIQETNKTSEDRVTRWAVGEPYPSVVGLSDSRIIYSVFLSPTEWSDEDNEVARVPTGEAATMPEKRWPQ